MLIDRFAGPWAVLSNFAPATVTLDGMVYPTVEHAYCAAKTVDPTERERIRATTTPGKAKRAGRKLVVRADWEQVKLSVMGELVRQKFTENWQAASLLALSGNARLVEGNNWHDRFWGECSGCRAGCTANGLNHLGEILMAQRRQL